MWIPSDYQQTITYLKKNGVADVITAIHAGANFFDNPSTYSGEHTEVEVHPIPAIFRNPANHRKWKKICEKHETDRVKCNGIITPSVEFNLVFLMVHMYQHFLREGIGFRQFVDYYFTLKVSTESQRTASFDSIGSLGMRDFAAAVMDIMKVVLGLGDEYYFANLILSLEHS